MHFANTCWLPRSGKSFHDVTDEFHDTAPGKFTQDDDAAPKTLEGKEPRGVFKLILASISSLFAGFVLSRLLSQSSSDLDLRLWGTTLPSQNALFRGRGFFTVAFDGSLFQENIFRQPPSPEVDRAWEGLGVDYRPAVVPELQAELAGLLPSQVRVSDEYGGGYIANVEGLHHLHCLNVLRQSLYFNVDYYKANRQGAFLNSESILRVHITHCLDILRQQLICQVDVGLLGQIWWGKESPEAFPDFSTKHLCRDFEYVREWAEDHQAPEKIPEDYLRPPREEDVFNDIP